MRKTLNKTFKTLIMVGIVGIAGIGLLTLTGCGAEDASAGNYGQGIQADIDHDPFTHLRTPYVGSAHETQAVVNALQLPGENWIVGSIQIGQDHGDFAESFSPYTLTIFYVPRQSTVISGSRDELKIPTDVFNTNSDLLFDLIENLQAVTFSVRFNNSESGSESNSLEGNDTDSNFFDYRWSRSRNGEFSLKIGNDSDSKKDSSMIFIDLMENVNLGFNNLHEVNYNDAFAEIRGSRFDGDGVRLVIWANKPIFNLSLIALGHDVIDDEIVFFATDVVYTVDELNSARADAFVINSYYGIGTMPWSGIAFEDEAGIRRYFAIMQSGYDGAFRLKEFEPWNVLESATNSSSPLVWIVPPTLEHDAIHLCNAGTFVDSQRRIIDPQTGLLTGTFCDGHGGPPPDFVFDRERELFGQTRYNDAYHGGVGMHPFGEIEETINPWTLGFTHGLIAVQSVDSSLREEFSDDYWDEWWLTDEAFLGQFAVMHNRQFVTDFIFDGAAHWWHMYRFATDPVSGQFAVLDMDYIAVSMNGKWGLIDREGNVALDFIFDNLVMIDANTAFARHNGSYGILDIVGTTSAMFSSNNTTQSNNTAQETGLIMVSGVITELGPFVEWSGDTAADTGSGFYIQIDFVDRYCRLVGDAYVMSGIPGQVSLFVNDASTLVLTHSPLEVGMIVTAYYDMPAPTTSGTTHTGTTITATALVSIDYSWVHIDRFDENFLSHDGSFSLAILDGAEIIYQDGTPFKGELSELANRILAVYVAMSASPPPDGPLVHGIASSRIIVLVE